MRAQDAVEAVLADVARRALVQLSLAAGQSSAALLAELIQSRRIHTWTTTDYQRGTYTAVSTGPRSIAQRERERCTEVHRPPSLHLT